MNSSISPKYTYLEQLICSKRDDIGKLFANNSFVYVNRIYLSPIQKRILEVHNESFQFLCSQLIECYQKKSDLSLYIKLLGYQYNEFDDFILKRLQSEYSSMTNNKRRKKRKEKRYKTKKVEIHKQIEKHMKILKSVGDEYKQILSYIFYKFNFAEVVSRDVLQLIKEAIDYSSENEPLLVLENNKFTLSLLKLVTFCLNILNNIQNMPIKLTNIKSTMKMINFQDIVLELSKIEVVVKEMNKANDHMDFQANKRILQVMSLKLNQLKDSEEDVYWFETNRNELLSFGDSYFSEYYEYLEDPSQFFEVAKSSKLKSKLLKVFSSSHNVFDFIKFFIYSFHLYPILIIGKKFRYSFTKINKTKLDLLHGKHKLLLHIIFWLFESALTKYVRKPLKKLNEEMLKLLRIFTCWIKSNRCVLQFAHRRETFVALLENLVNLIWKFQPKLEYYTDIHRPCRPNQFKEDEEVKGIIAFNCELSDFNDSAPCMESDDDKRLFRISELVKESDENYLRLQAIYVSIIKFLSAIK